MNLNRQQQYNKHMAELNDYQAQVLKLKRWNRNLMIAVALFMLGVFFLMLGWAVINGHKRNEQNQRIIDAINYEIEQNRKRAEAGLCIITTPIPDRSIADTDQCLKNYGLDYNQLKQGPNYER